VANDFLTRARELGVTYQSKTQALEFLVEGGRVRGVSTDHGEIAAPIVVSATGPWTRPLFQRIGIELPIETEYHQVANLYAPVAGYFPLAPLTGFAVLVGWATVMLGLATLRLRRSAA